MIPVHFKQTASSVPAQREQPAVAIRDLSVSYGGKPALLGISADVEAASMTAIIGPNGAGKSTLLKAALAIVPRLSGTVDMFGQPIAKVRQRVAYVPQRASVDWDFPARAEDVVMMGLSRELGLLGRIRQHHREFVMHCLERVGMAGFADRQIGQLSGGQQQRVFLARALAQKADLYLLDEPFAGVDAATERAIIGVLKALRDEGRTVVCVHHDLSTVPAYFSHVLVINMRLIAQGPVDEAFTPAILQRAYGGRLDTASLAPAGPSTAPEPDLALETGR